MIRWREGVVTGLGAQWAGARTVRADVDGVSVEALAYLDLVGSPAIGDRVLLNVTTLLLGLGTGGYAMVVALPDRLPNDPVDRSGHVVKARYTPLQTTVLGVDEQQSPHHRVLRDADDLTGMPVVVADLHSALPAVLAGLYNDRPGTHVAYVMTDGAALPLAFSSTVAALTTANWLAGSVTAGQSFGGDLEAVTLHTGLLAARHVLGAEAAVVTQGPGNTGTDTRWGYSGVSAGEAVNAVVALGGRPIGALRVSQADERPRHRGISHHSLTAYGRVALSAADIAVPVVDSAFGRELRQQASQLRARHTVVEVPVEGLEAALRDCPVRLSTMGRGLHEDPMYFVAAAAAGRHAATMLS